MGIPREIEVLESENPVNDFGSSQPRPPSRGVHAPEPVDADEPQPLMEGDWMSEYRECPRAGSLLERLDSNNQRVEWPSGVRLDVRRGRMYEHGRMCVPKALTGQSFEGTMHKLDTQVEIGCGKR